MTGPVVVVGTDTNIGKTVFSAALVGALDGCYWKPIQSGLEAETDSDTVRRLCGLPHDRVLPEAYRLHTPASPHLAAEIDGVTIEESALSLPQAERPLVVEGSGGLLVPLTREIKYIDVIGKWAAPVVLCARTSLGTINHTLLSIEALRARNISILGVAFIGEENADSEEIIVEMGSVQRLGRLPYLASLTREALSAAFASAFDLAHVLEEKSV